MTNRIVIGIDPGMTGAIATLADGCLAHLFDTPVVARGKGRNEVSASALAELLRGVRSEFPGANFSVAVEEVSAMPGGGQRTMGATSAFNFGRGVGIIEGVVAALGFQLIRVLPQTWKKHYKLIGKEKDVARGKAIDMFPTASLHRKKDIGRADALLIAAWAQATEAWNQ